MHTHLMSANQIAGNQGQCVTSITPGPTVVLLIGPLIESESLLLSSSGGMLQGIKVKVM